MPEKMGTVSDANPQQQDVDINELIDKEELARKVFALLLRELELESERSGKAL